LVTSYDLWPANGAGLFSKEKISKEKSGEKRISGGAYEIACKSFTTGEITCS